MRRIQRAALFAGVAAIFPVGALAIPAQIPAAEAAGLFQPPAEPMILTRTLRRSLAGGAEVVTQRRYEIRIVSQSGGFRVDGRLLDVTVDAPAGLEELAALERRRNDEGMFPLRLDASGMLLPVEPTPASAETRQAIDLTLRKVDDAGFSAADLVKARAFVTQIAAQSGRSAWPEDLFRPEPGQRRQTQAIPLPNGGQGQVVVVTDATTGSQSGMLASFVRKVTTILGQDARVTEETWTLSDKG